MQKVNIVIHDYTYKLVQTYSILIIWCYPLKHAVSWRLRGVLSEGSESWCIPPIYDRKAIAMDFAKLEGVMGWEGADGVKTEP